MQNNNQYFYSSSTCHTNSNLNVTFGFDLWELIIFFLPTYAMSCVECWVLHVACCTWVTQKIFLFCLRKISFMKNNQPRTQAFNLYVDVRAGTEVVWGSNRIGEWDSVSVRVSIKMKGAKCVLATKYRNGKMEEWVLVLVMDYDEWERPQQHNHEDCAVRKCTGNRAQMSFTWSHAKGLSKIMPYTFFFFYKRQLFWTQSGCS